MTTDEKLHAMYEVALRAANSLRELKRDTKGGVSQFAETMEQETRRRMKELGSPDWMLTELK